MRRPRLFRPRSYNADVPRFVAVTTTGRAVGTIYTNGQRRRIVTVTVSVGNGATATYSTTVAGTVVSGKQFAGVTGLTGAVVVSTVTFVVDPRAAYQVTGGTLIAWVEVDE